MNDIPILDLRRIEANIIKPIYEEMALEIGHEKAEKILGAAIEKAAIEQGNRWQKKAREGRFLEHLFRYSSDGKWGAR